MIRQAISNILHFAASVLVPWRKYDEAQQVPHQGKTKLKHSRPIRGISRQQRMIKWCADFNARNGYVVPSKSVESIYRKAHAR